MRTWVTSTRDRRCGGCDAAITKGTPMLEIQLVQVRTLVRCPACAGEPVPETALAPVPIDAVAARARAVARLIPDWPWLREGTRPVFMPDLVSVPVADAWSPFRDDRDDDDQGSE